VSQQSSRRAALGAAVLGVLLALSVGLGTALAPSAPATVGARTTTLAHDAAISASTSHVSPSSLRAVRPPAARTVGVDRLTGGPGYAVVAAALLVLACMAVVAGATTAWRRSSSLTRSASGPRAPPAFAAC
jgi:hypothetical protein